METGWIICEDYSGKFINYRCSKCYAESDVKSDICKHCDSVMANADPEESERK